MTGSSASIAATEGLQEVFRDLLRLAVVGDHARRAIRGEGSSEVAEWLRVAVPQWRDWAEVLARHMTNVDIAPDGRVKTLARDITRQWIPAGWLTVRDATNLLATRLTELVMWTHALQSTTAGSEEACSLAEIESGSRAQLRALVQLGPAT